ncbi:A-kinase anchor protein 10, mitochondrial [Ostrinia nubilalis]|uniref:A-kinase anchor protein 10, mitochondrial n=1 Tax=Ostrinia nubilalis TaxID=29057 RepID=UPI0030822AE8
MIKFWKSAAKGKSGCPVRPPEPSTSSNIDNRTLLDTELDDVEDELQFEKKTKLYLSLHDILIEKKALKYFVKFMDTVEKPMLIKCWLEIESFQRILSTSNSNDKVESHSKISRAKSFDFNCKCHAHNEKSDYLSSQKNLWREKINEKFHSTSESRKYGNSSSCLNLSDYADSTNACRECCMQDGANVTELAINLFKNYIALEAPYQLDLPDSLRKMVISNICQPEGLIKPDCFKPVQDVLFNQIENYFKEFQNSPFNTKAQIDILTSGSISLKDILYHDTLLFYFTEYLEQETCRHLLEFLMAVMHFRDNLRNGNTPDADQAQADAIVLYDKYFSLQATNPIGFPTYIRLKIENDICIEGGPQYTCFDLPYKIVFKTLSRYVTTFLESELYYKLLSEMIHSVDQSWSHNRSQSDCSSEFSISTQNTLLAMGDPVFRKKKRNHSVPDMTIDSNQLYNADSLWQRKRQDGLSLGRVNSLGRFESKFEPDPDKKDRSVLKKMVSRFVPTTTSKVEEEMAWQIAHMIVKDVTDLTLAPPENDQDEV